MPLKPPNAISPHPTEFKSDKNRQAFRRRLRRWFRANARDLPWRRTQDPYAVWVSEIMLQQTQVVTVVPYYERFLKQFPTVSDLAAADESTVLKLWEGLGYYRRARQLHRAAQVIVEDHGGIFPTRFEDVLSLPGIGRYTAGAILSIALDQMHPIVEGNTVRVYSRLDGFDGRTDDRQGQNHLWSFAENLVTRQQPGELNQALMELGSEICTPREPSCPSCPVRVHCRAFETGDPTAFPASSRRMNYEDRYESAVVVEREKRVLMRECGPGERWAGLWDFPRFDVSTKLAKSQHATFVTQALHEATGLNVELKRPFWETRHAVTRFRIRLTCYRYRLTESDTNELANQNGFRWIQVARLQDLPLSVTGRLIADEIQSG